MLLRVMGQAPAACCAAIIWGISLYGIAATGGLGVSIFGMYAGVMAGILTQDLMAMLESPQFEKEFKECKDCLERVVNK